MFASFKRAVPSMLGTAAESPQRASQPALQLEPQSALQAVISGLARQASTLGREAAEVRGVLDDTKKIADLQAQAVQTMARQVHEVVKAQSGIGGEAAGSLKAVADVGEAVQSVANEVQAIVTTLRQVSDAAAQITQIALQTRLVAFNASVEARRAGEAGRGFGVVAAAVKDLAGQVEGSSKQIMGTIGQLDTRIASLAREIRHEQSAEKQGAVHRALMTLAERVHRIQVSSVGSAAVCHGLEGQIHGIESEMRRTTGSLGSALDRTETLLKISEQLIERVAECGAQTEDTPYIHAVQQAAKQIGQLLEDALRTGAIDEADLFDEQYRPITGSAPAQHDTRFVALADRLFPQVQERMLKLSDKVVFCIAVDRNGYVACHNRQYNQAQRAGDLTWNTANCRNKRIFNDRTGLGSARNQRAFLLQTYRRDMGGGAFVVMKEAAAPIVVKTRHWGGVRLAFKF